MTTKEKLFAIQHTFSVTARQFFWPNGLSPLSVFWSFLQWKRENGANDFPE